MQSISFLHLFFSLVLAHRRLVIAELFWVLNKVFFFLLLFQFHIFFGKTITLQTLQTSDLFLVSSMWSLPYPKLFHKTWFLSLIYFFTSPLWGLFHQRKANATLRHSETVSGEATPSFWSLPQDRVHLLNWEVVLGLSHRDFLKLYLLYLGL